MRYLLIFIYIIYIIVYVYSCNKISTNPDETIWGYICTLCFGIIFIFSVNLYLKHEQEKKKNNDIS